MSKTMSADFKSRRDAETAVEHIVQEHGIDRSAVTIAPAGDDNTAGTEAARADIEDGRLKEGTEGEPALEGEIRVTVAFDDGLTEKVMTSFETYGGRAIDAA
ncbi:MULTISPECIES: hypothetical protein [unclassified Methylobacterium]|uniref:hypothetical protein n=1 Tax=unclassified Methylobacterium TaxID=2615210 RepID=UPI0006FDD9EA|nr:MULTISPECIES: hypothetical protein [unclassified Methylobacterium]KQP13962.1 hypothetical protein ASF26_18470 [Methylobacterium sp. Leaf93]MCC0807804.1 hypothetical protein [Methylobacterium sp. W2]